MVFMAGCEKEMKSKFLLNIYGEIITVSNDFVMGFPHDLSLWKIIKWISTNQHFLLDYKKSSSQNEASSQLIEYY